VNRESRRSNYSVGADTLCNGGGSKGWIPPPPDRNMDPRQDKLGHGDFEFRQAVSKEEREPDEARWRGD